MSSECTLRMKDVSFRYPAAAALAVSGVSFELFPGDGIALLGANGAGKTTLLRLAMALVHPSSGTVEIAGRDTAGLAPEDIAAHAGYLFQHPELQLLERTVVDEVAYGLRHRGISPPQAAEMAAAALSETGIATYAAEHPYDLSPSLRRLVALAAALAPDPEVLLLDEPTAGLDRAARERVAAIVAARRRRGTAVLAVTHDGEFALESLGTALVVDAGRVTGRGLIEDVLGTRADLPALPAAAIVARRLALPTPSLRSAAVAEALGERCRHLG